MKEKIVRIDFILVVEIKVFIVFRLRKLLKLNCWKLKLKLF